MLSDLLIKEFNLEKFPPPECGGVTPRDYSALHKLAEDLIWQATHDALTGTGNRRLLEAWWRQASKRQQGPDKGLAIIMLDIEKFKNVNDEYGHACGDFVLQATARHLAENTRPEDQIVRLGGDEFAILLMNVSQADTDSVRGRLNDLFPITLKYEGRQISVNAHVANTLWLDPSQPLEDNLKKIQLEKTRTPSVANKPVFPIHLWQGPKI